MKIAIRDDDTSYWTKPEELEKVYKKLFDKGFKVSLAVTPNAYKLYYPSDRSKFYISDNTEFIDRNRELVFWLKDMIRDNYVEIMHHGYDHSYYVMEEDNTIRMLTKNVRTELNCSGKKYSFIPELKYKDYHKSLGEIKKGKEILEDTFSVKMKIFVPPSNTLTRETAKAVIENGYNISGIIGRDINREINYYTLKNYGIKNLWKIFNKFPYPKVLKYKNHEELSSVAITPKSDFKKINSNYIFCKNKSIDFNIATHYWEIIENENLAEAFYEFLFKISDDSEKNFLSELIRK